MEYDKTSSYEGLSHKEKKLKLYQSQKRLLETFLERNAISKEQYNKSLRDLTTKMGMNEYQE